MLSQLIEMKAVLDAVDTNQFSEEETQELLTVLKERNLALTDGN